MCEIGRHNRLDENGSATQRCCPSKCSNRSRPGSTPSVTATALRNRSEVQAPCSAASWVGRALPRRQFGLVSCSLPSALAQLDFAAADAARGTFGDRGTTIFRMFGVLPVGAITSLGVMLTSQGGFATARAGILPRWFARITPGGTPMRALGLTTAASAAFLWSDAHLSRQ